MSIILKVSKPPNALPTLSEENSSLTNPNKKQRSFTLVELIIVIILVGILAAIGISQYSLTVEKSRLAEAKTRIGTMRQLAYQFYLEHGSLDGMQNADVGVDNTCASTDFYLYKIGSNTGTYADLHADRCTSGGKTPNASWSYFYYLHYFPGTGQGDWRCHYPDGTPCFGLPY